MCLEIPKISLTSSISFFSAKTLLIFFFHLPLPFYLFGVMTAFMPGFYIDWISEIFERNNSIDTFTVLGFMALCYIFGPLANVVVAPAISHFPQTTSLVSPNNKTGLLLSYIGLVTGSFVLMLGFFFARDESNESPKYVQIVGSLLLPFLGFLMSFTHYFWTSFIVCCWLSQFIEECNNNGCSLEKVEKLLAMYTEIERSLCFYFVFIFSTAQLNWITQGRFKKILLSK